MDIFAHMLWAGAAARGLNRRRPKITHKPIRPWAAAFWGVAPDLFAFTIPFVWLFYGLITGEPRPSFRPPENDHGLAAAQSPMFFLAHGLYDVSHSAVIFTAVILLVWAWKKLKQREENRVLWEMSGWLLHILIDIPTHTDRFFPTPVFQPFSDAVFRHGISWGVPWFMALNYTALILVWIYILKTKRHETA